MTLLSRHDNDGGVKGDCVEAESVVKSGGVVDECDVDGDGDENDERADEDDELLPALALHKQQTVIEVFACKTPSPERETSEAAAASGM